MGEQQRLMGHIPSGQEEACFKVIRKKRNSCTDRETESHFIALYLKLNGSFAEQFIYINHFLKLSNLTDAFLHSSNAGVLPFLVIICHSLFIRDACFFACVHL